MTTERVTCKGNLHNGEKVKIEGERGTVYFVADHAPSPDGSIMLYGGSTNPNGRRGYRSVMPDRIKKLPAKRKKNA